MSRVKEWNTLLSKMRDIALWFYGFTTGLEKMQQQYRSRMTLASACVLYLNLLLYI